jgi:multiple sugar transport system substrate-binding protein
MKKVFFGFLILMIIISMVATFSLIGCKPESISEEVAAEAEAVAEEETAVAETVTLKILGSSGSFLEAIIETFESELASEGIVLEDEYYDWLTYDEKQKLAMTSGGGGYDLVFLPGIYVPIWVNAGGLVDVDSITKEIFPDVNDIYKSVQNDVIIDGKFYITPFSAEGMVYWYRTDIYEQEGLKIPETIDEMYETSKKLTKDNIYGIAYPGGPSEGSCSFWSYFLWSYGGDYFDNNWVPQLNTPEAVQSAEMFAKILQDCAPEGVTTWQNDETVAAFSSGNLAAMIMWPGYLSSVADEEQSQVFDKFAIGPVPKGPSGEAVPRYGCWGLGVTKTGEAKMEAAAKFIESFINKETLESMATNYTVTCSKSANTLPAAMEKNQSLAACHPVLDTARERPGIPESAQYIEAVGAAINSINTGLPAKTTLDDLQEKVYSIMEEAGYYE